MSKEKLELAEQMAELKAYGDKKLAEFEREMNERLDESTLVTHVENEAFKKKAHDHTDDVLKKVKQLRADAILTTKKKMGTKN
jgi:hypothetical protein